VSFLFGLPTIIFANPSFYIKHLQYRVNTIELGARLDVWGYVYVFVSPPDQESYYLIYPSNQKEEHPFCTCWYKILGKWQLGKKGIYRFIFLVTSSPIPHCCKYPPDLYNLLLRSKTLIWITQGFTREFYEIGNYYWIRLQ